MTAIDIVVSAGPDLGLRAALAGEPLVVGRGRDAGLQLTDMTVSRRHLSIRATGVGITVEVLDGASPFSVRGAAQERAELQLGERFIIGNTALTAVLRMPKPAVEGACDVTAVRSLLGEMAVDARGLAAIFELSEQLDGAREIAELEELVVAWAQKHVRAEAAALDIGDEDAPISEDLVEQQSEGGRVLLSVPLIGVPGAALSLTIPAQADRVTPELRRLLAVAGRVVASSLMRLRAYERVSRQMVELRRLAVGSASSFLGRSPGAERVGKLLERLAASDAVALIVGETGVGKSFLARLIHEASARAGEPLRVINCASIPENLLEAELFGHERGAFTGAAGAREGALEAAGRGTVLLDEIGDLPLTSQAKLLRVLEEKQFERLGSNRTQQLRARVLCATNRELKQMVADGTFRNDLFFRVSVITVPVPALRERADDVPLLAERFLGDLAPSAGRRVTGFSAAAIAALKRYRWPGNVRELRNVIEHALVLGDGAIIEPSDLPAEVAGRETPAPTSADGDRVTLPMDLAALEKLAIEAALRHTGGNRTRAAAVLGINRVTLYKKLKGEEGPEEPE